jgi:ferredoxin
MPIDLTSRIIQPKIKPAMRLHPIRRAVQLIGAAVIVLLPITNGMRVDVTSGFFWVLGQRYTSQNVILLFFACAIGVVLLLTVSTIYGRWWCGWICPQTLASDFGDSLRTRFNRMSSGFGTLGRALSTPAWATLMIATAVATSAVVLSYFYPPRAVWEAVISPMANPRISLHLAIISTVISANLLWVRRKFCRRGCPYGLMLSVVGDSKTMTVRYLTERDDDCIGCGKCVTVCPMSIDIKLGANQMECIGCGECIDACNDILPMIKSNPKRGLIELRYGIDPSPIPANKTPLQRLGLWDSRRVFLCFVVLALGCGLLLTLFGTRATSLTVSPSGTIAEKSSELTESYRLNIANGKPSDISYVIGETGVGHIETVNKGNALTVGRSAQKTFTLTLAAPVHGLIPGRRYPVIFSVTSIGASPEQHDISTYFYVPERQSQKESEL